MSDRWHQNKIKESIKSELIAHKFTDHKMEWESQLLTTFKYGKTYCWKYCDEQGREISSSDRYVYIDDMFYFLPVNMFLRFDIKKKSTLTSKAFVKSTFFLRSTLVLSVDKTFVMFSTGKNMYYY